MKRPQIVSLRSRTRFALLLVLLAAVLAWSVPAAFKMPPFIRAVRKTLRVTGLLPAANATLEYIGLRRYQPPTYVPLAPFLPPDRSTPRLLAVKELEHLLGASDFAGAAKINASLAQEALIAAYRNLKAWETLRNSRTALLPKSFRPADRFWNAKDVAADLFPHLFYAASILDPQNHQLWLDSLAAERRLCGPMPCSLQVDTAAPIRENRDHILGSAAEYARDGLLALVERLGRGPWFDRMEEVSDVLIAAAATDSSAGKLISGGSEDNGNFLQVLVRLYWATGRAKYLEMAERIADAYLLDALPANAYMAANQWNFSAGKAASLEFRLRDHGSEIVPGLAELYLLEKLHGSMHAARYRYPLERFLDHILALPRTEDGLFYSGVDAATGEVLDDEIVDTWGYLLTAYHAFDIAEKSTKYAPEIERIMRAAAARRSFRWERLYADGPADSIESMIYLLPFYNVPEGRYWTDEEMEVFLARQQPDGFVEKRYLDGNFVRTLLLYTSYKMQGARLEPWNAETSLGAAVDPRSGKLYLHLTARRPYRGKLIFDTTRHASFWNLPLDYPRINGQPEWFVADPGRAYVLVDPTMRKSTHVTGWELSQGWPMEMPAGSRSITIEAINKAP